MNSLEIISETKVVSDKHGAGINYIFNCPQKCCERHIVFIPIVPDYKLAYTCPYCEAKYEGSYKLVDKNNELGVIIEEVRELTPPKLDKVPKLNP